MPDELDEKLSVLAPAVLGDAYAKKGECDKALAPYHEAMSILTNVLGENHTTVVGLHRVIAGVYEKLGDHTQVRFRIVLADECREQG